MRIGELYSHGVYYHKSDVPRNLREFVNYLFSSNIYIENDFKSFNTKFRNTIKKLLPDRFELHYWNRGHYYCSGVIKTPNDKFIYISIPDVRFFNNEWVTNILYRTMKHDKDWTGGPNNYTSLFTFTEDIKKLYKED